MKSLTASFCSITVLTSLVAFNAQAEQPCWLETPVNGDAKGQVGVARDLWIGGPKPEQMSAQRAIARLCGMEGKVCENETLTDAYENKSLFGKPLHFDYYRHNGYVHSYASYGPADSKQCEPLACSISQCKPEWLCNATASEDNTVLGISYRAVTPDQQHKLSINNGLYQAEFLYGVDVWAKAQMLQGQVGTQAFTILTQEGNVDTGDKEILSHHVKQQCRSNDTLFSQIVFNGDAVVAQSEHLDLSWMKNPKAHGLDGAVGSAEKPAASGLVSDQIKIAIERAAKTLAFEKKAIVKSDEIVVTNGKGGLINIRNLTQDTNVNLKARVQRFHFEETKGPFLKVYVWLVTQTEA